MNEMISSPNNFEPTGQPLEPQVPRSKRPFNRFSYFAGMGTAIGGALLALTIRAESCDPVAVDRGSLRAMCQETLSRHKNEGKQPATIAICNKFFPGIFDESTKE